MDNDSRCQKPWTQEETEYLREKWGELSIPKLAENLKRTPQAIKLRASRLKLGAVLMSGDYITLNQLIAAVVGTETSSSYKLTSWVKERKLPVHTRKVENCRFRVVYLKEFWKWAEQNRSFLDFNKFEPLALGEEPDWVALQRKKDAVSFSLQRKCPWTEYEDQKLQHLLKMHCYSYNEISKELQRSNGAVQKRIIDLGLRERPVRAVSKKWTEAQVQMLLDGVLSGDGFMMIAESVGKSEKALRGKLFQMYGTESPDKARKLIMSSERRG